AIGEYFNQLLIFSIRNNYGQEKLSIDTVTDEWYKERLEVLIPEPLQTEVSDMRIGVDDFLSEYKRQVDTWNKSSSIETFVFDIPRKKPVPFVSEIRIQNRIANMLYFILDIDAKGFGNLALQQRLWICENIFKTDLSVIENFTFGETSLFDSYSTIIELEEKNGR
ncbi:MAG: hypothetical protein K2O42_08660, partial [Oscillospiraceae bacterium]|nr:hypothetical protein [Oscillospiraceae bacterium]